MSSVVKRYDVVAGRKYDSRGEEKTHWINVGEAAEWDDGGISLRLHAVPVGQWFDGTLKLFEKKPREGGESRAAPIRSAPQRSESRDDLESDSIPF